MKTSFKNTLLAACFNLSLYPTLSIAATYTPYAFPYYPQILVTNTAPYTQNNDINLSSYHDGTIAVGDIALLSIVSGGKFTNNPTHSLTINSSIIGVPNDIQAVTGSLIYVRRVGSELFLNGQRDENAKSNINLHLHADGLASLLRVADHAKSVVNNVDMTQSGYAMIGIEVKSADLAINNSNTTLDKVALGISIGGQANGTSSKLTIENSTITANQAINGLISVNGVYQNSTVDVTINHSSLKADSEVGIISIGTNVGVNNRNDVKVNNTLIENGSATGPAIRVANQGAHFSLSGGQVTANGNALYVMMLGDISVTNTTLTSHNDSALHAQWGGKIDAENVNIYSGNGPAVHSNGTLPSSIMDVSLITLNNANIYTQDTAFMAKDNGKIDAALDGNVVQNGTNLIDAGTNGIVNLSASNMQLAGNILGANAHLSLNHTYWAGNALNAGNVALADHATWLFTDHSDVASLTNDGTVIFNAPPLGTTLTVYGDYTSNNGQLIFSGQLADDSSVVNKMVIDGDSHGTTAVTVNNVGGLGAQTVNGIELITVAGQSGGEFTQQGRIMAGGYNYNLLRSALNSNNWVLMNSGVIGPEPGSYLANIYSANNLFNIRLHDRVSDTRYIDVFTGQSKVTSMWLRHQYGYNQFNAVDGELSIKNNWNLTQLGGDIGQWSSNGNNRFHLGVMAGYGRSKNSSTHDSSGERSHSKVDGYSYGVYGTWFDNQETKQGLYVDSWVMWNRFNGSLSSDAASSKYRLQGLTAAVESGYTFNVGQVSKSVLLLEPQGQLIWQGVKAKDSVEDNGTRASSNDGNLLSRLGVRGTLQPLDAFTSNSTGQLFLELNWLHNTKLYNVTLNDENTFSQDSARNIAEIKTGVEGYINKNTGIWFNVSGQIGNNHYRSAAILLGVKHSF